MSQFPAQPRPDPGDPTELARVLSRYDTGIIESIVQIRRGSAGSIKWAVQCERGGLLLKRRPLGDSPAALRFMHMAQDELAKAGVPLPALIPPRRVGNGKVETGPGSRWVRLDGRVYEVFLFLPGGRYDRTSVSAMEAGRTLALVHAALAQIEASGEVAPTLSSGFFRALKVQTDLVAAGERLGHDVRAVTKSLGAMYSLACERAITCGAGDWPRQLIHGDWHPGNLLFEGSKVVGVIDYDTLRADPRAMDVAYGALQFSALRAEGPLDQWPPGVEMSCLEAFIRGYEAVPGATLSRAELDGLAWLMICALVSESASVIGGAGSFGTADPVAVLRMVERKCAWLRDNQPILASAAG